MHEINSGMVYLNPARICAVPLSMASGWQHPIRTPADRIQRLRPLNLVRLNNAVNSYAGYQKNQRGKRVDQRAWPMSLSIEPTTSCNLRCPECPSGLRSFTRPTGMLKTALLEQALAEMGRHLVYLNLYFQGEPYLHPEMDELVAIGRSHGLYTSTSTNAHFLRPERCASIVQSGLSRLIISIDGITQPTYSAYRVGGQLEKVLDGTRNMVNARKEHGGKGPHLVWQFLVVGPNEHEVDEIQRQARAIGVDELVIKTAQLDDPHDGHPLLTQNPQFRRYDRTSVGTWHIRNALNDECWRMWQGCVITWDGKVVPCCFDKDAEHAMGTIGEQPFRDIWFGERYQAFRRQIFTDRAGVAMCQNCSEGSHAYA